MITIVDPIATYAGSRPNSLAIGDAESGERWNYAALDAAIDRVAAYLVRELGAASGKRVATLARNDVNMVILHFGCIRAGAIFVPFNWRLAAAEIAVLAADAMPVMLFNDADFEATGFACTVHLLADLLDIAGNAPTQPPTDARRDFCAPSTLLYTSGTSGVPKGVMVSEENATWGNLNFILGNDVGTGSVFLCDMPLFHTAGLYAATRVPLCAGGAVWISKGFDAAKTLSRIADPMLGITHYFSSRVCHRRSAKSACANRKVRTRWHQYVRRFRNVGNRLQFRNACGR
jgi:fatty-acyl-CoA synthase